MSDKKKWPRSEALQVAEEMKLRLLTACERIAIVGSLRRGKEEVGDAELLFVPRLSERPDGLFDQCIVSVASEVLNQCLQDGILAKRRSKTGVFSWGEANKLAIHVASGIPFDFFSTSAPCWWNSLVIRTGSKETNLALTTGANKLNRTLNTYGAGVTNRATGEVIPTTSERHVFDLCGVPYLQPRER